MMAECDFLVLTVQPEDESVRIDKYLSAQMETLSRSYLQKLLKEGQVFVNGKLITSNGYEPREGDIISVRGKGRFIYDGTSHQTRKGRSSIQLSLYI